MQLSMNREREAALLQEIGRLTQQLDEANSIVNAIKHGEIDALLVSGAHGDRVYILEGADHVYRVLVEEMHEGCATISADGTILFCNKSFADILHTPLERVIGSSFLSLLPPEVLRYVTSYLALGGKFRTECTLRKQDQAVPVILAASTIHVDGEKFACIVLTDLTGQKRSERLTQTILNQARDPIIACDKAGVITLVNPAAIGLFGPELLGRHFDAVVPLFSQMDGCLVKLDQIIEDNSPAGIEVQYHQKVLRTLLVKAGKFITEDLLDYEVGSVITLTDITEKQLLESELARLDRLNVIGEVAAGIGHEVRNPLTTVRGYLQMFTLREKYGDDRKRLELMIEELDRANSIITEFLSLAKNKAVERQEGCLNDTLKALLPMLEADAFMLGHQLDVILGDIPVTHYDDKEIRQLVLNLFRNALEAMPSRGIVQLRTYTEGCDVILAVSDTGSGIPAEAQEKLGRPFFTTKDSGTGLGLSVCYSIADRHDAKLSFDTAATGTTFYVRFPI